MSQITEQLLVHFLIKLAEWGYGLKLSQLQVVIAQYLNNTAQGNIFKNGKPGYCWYKGFLKRWKNELSVRVAGIKQIKEPHASQIIQLNRFSKNAKKNMIHLIFIPSQKIYGMLMKRDFLVIKEKKK